MSFKDVLISISSCINSANCETRYCPDCRQDDSVTCQYCDKFYCWRCWYQCTEACEGDACERANCNRANNECPGSTGWWKRSHVRRYSPPNDDYLECSFCDSCSLLPVLHAYAIKWHAFICFLLWLIESIVKFPRTFVLWLKKEIARNFKEQPKEKKRKRKTKIKRRGYYR